MNPQVISIGELLVEFIREEKDIPHGKLGAVYKGPFPSGAPAIYIDTAARMGKNFKLTTGFIGVIGNDEFGSCIIEKLNNDEIDISQIRITEKLTTGIAFNQYNSDGSRKFIFAKGAAGETSPEDINLEFFENVKNLHIMGSALSISKKSREACYKAINIAKNSNPDVTISFDPNIRPEMLDIESILEMSIPVLNTSKILLPSGKEAEMLAGVKGAKKACQKLLKMGPEIIVLKQGKQGCTFFTSDDHDGQKVKGFKAIERDPTGAGDSFGGAFIIGYLAGWDLIKATTFANAVGALKVEYFGPMANTSYENAIKFMKANE